MNVEKKKTNVMKQVGLFIWIAVVVIGFFGIFVISKPYEASEEFWLPEDASVVNMIKGEYTPISKVSLSGTAVYISFENYQQRFRYASVDKSVIVLPEGAICYLAKIGENLYASMTKPVYDMPFHSDPKMKGISKYSEHKKNWILPTDTAVLELYYGRNWFMVGFCFIVWTVFIFLLRKLAKREIA